MTVVNTGFVVLKENVTASVDPAIAKHTGEALTAQRASVLGIAVVTELVTVKI